MSAAAGWIASIPIPAHGAPTASGFAPPVVTPGQARAGRPAQIEIESNGLRARITLRAGHSKDHQASLAFDLNGQAQDQAAAAALGYGSMTALVEADCDPPRDKVERMDVYSQAALSGVHEVRPVPGVWGKPSAGSIMNDILIAVCAQAANPPKSAPAAPERVEAKALGAPPDSMMVPAPSATDAAEDLVDQLGAYSEASSARGRLAGATPLAPSLRGVVERRSVGGKEVFRAVVTGFAAASDAYAYCAALHQQGQTCWTRKRLRADGD